MFMTEFECQPFGCMGIRWQDKNWDIYNMNIDGQNLVHLTDDLAKDNCAS